MGRADLEHVLTEAVMVRILLFWGGVVLYGCGGHDGDAEQYVPVSSGHLTYGEYVPESAIAKADALQEHSGEDTRATTTSCTITLCLTGAMDHDTPSNAHFRALCADPRVKGLHSDCAFGQCRGTFDSFLQFPLLTVYPSLVDAMDRNRDGVVDHADPVCEVNLLGFSWGGVNVLSVAQHLAYDARIPATHRTVHRAVLIDAYQPFSTHRMHMPRNIASALSVRHSQASANDCSAHAPLGPYLGLSPVATSTQMCADYDYSKADHVLFRMADGRGLYGDEIGHCEVPAAAHEFIIAHLNDRAFDGPLPAEGSCIH